MSFKKTKIYRIVIINIPELSSNSLTQPPPSHSPQTGQCSVFIAMSWLMSALFSVDSLLI